MIACEATSSTNTDCVPFISCAPFLRVIESHALKTRNVTFSNYVLSSATGVLLKIVLPLSLHLSWQLGLTSPLDFRFRLRLNILFGLRLRVHVCVCLDLRLRVGMRSSL